MSIACCRDWVLHFSQSAFVFFPPNSGRMSVYRLARAADRAPINSADWASFGPFRFASRMSFSMFIPPPTDPPADRTADDLGPAKVETAGIDRLPTDDWPQLYLKERRIPTVNLRGMALIAGLSLAILLAFAPVRRVRPDGRMFFLGAGFMLLETKGVVHMTLLFGSTWLVNSVVFFAILVMVLASNLFVWFVRPANLRPYYALLAGVLILNLIVPMSTFLALPGFQKVVASCAMTFIPIFFAAASADLFGVTSVLTAVAIIVGLIGVLGSLSRTVEERARWSRPRRRHREGPEVIQAPATKRSRRGKRD